LQPSPPQRPPSQSGKRRRWPDAGEHAAFIEDEVEENDAGLLVWQSKLLLVRGRVCSSLASVGYFRWAVTNT
jgi:hypothetical protein